MRSDHCTLDYARHFLFALLLTSVNVGVILTSLVTPLDEPYWNWRRYLERWAELFVVHLAIVCLLVATGCFIITLIRTRAAKSIALSLPGLTKLLWTLPVSVIWSTARFIAAPSTDWRFSFGDAPRHLGWVTDVSKIVAGAGGGIALVMILMTAAIIGMRAELRRDRSTSTVATNAAIRCMARRAAPNAVRRLRNPSTRTPQISPGISDS